MEIAKHVPKLPYKIPFFATMMGFGIKRVYPVLLEAHQTQKKNFGVDRRGSGSKIKCIEDPCIYQLRIPKIKTLVLNLLVLFAACKLFVPSTRAPTTGPAYINIDALTSCNLRCLSKCKLEINF